MASIMLEYLVDILNYGTEFHKIDQYFLIEQSVETAIVK